MGRVRVVALDLTYINQHFCDGGGVRHQTGPSLYIQKVIALSLSSHKA